MSSPAPPLAHKATPDRPGTLTEAREAAGLTKAALARSLHVSRPLVSTWKKGVRRPSRCYWPALAAALGLEVGAVPRLFTGQPPSRLDAEPLPALSIARRRAGLSQRTVARLVGAAPTTVSMWERAGIRVAPATAARLALLLRTTPEALMRPPQTSPRAARDPRPLRRLRTAAGMSRAEAAAHLGVSLATVSRYEAAERRPPVVVAQRMARAYRRPLAEVLDCCGITLAPLPGGATWTVADVPAAIRAAREARGLTKVALGRAVSRSGQAVHKWELGQTHPGPGTCRRLEAVLGLPAGKLPARSAPAGGVSRLATSVPPARSLASGTENGAARAVPPITRGAEIR